MKTIVILLRNIFLLTLLIGFQKKIIAQEDNSQQLLEQRLRVYYVEDPNNDDRPHPVRITRDSDIFGGNPNMEHAQTLIRAIFGTGELHDPFREQLANGLRTFRKPMAIFIYNDIEPLEQGVSSMWVNCIDNQHFFSCATISGNNNYQRILHYGTQQLNNEEIAFSKAGIIRLLTQSRGSSGWWDDVPIETLEGNSEDFEVCVPFSSDYEEFRRSVVNNSSEIRQGMISRSEPHYAEEVIDRRPKLREIHQSYTELNTTAGESICLMARIYRDSRNYVALILFQARDVHNFENEEVETTDDRLYPEDLRHDMTRDREERIVTNMGYTNLPPRGTTESGRLEHMRFMSTLRGYRRAWHIYFTGSGTVGNVQAFGYTEFQQPGADRALREMRSLENQPPWMKIRVFQHSNYLLRQMDNNIERIENILLDNE